MVVNYKLKIKNKELDIPVKICNNILSQTMGLMFRKNSPNLLFIFKKPTKISIHSFFCKRFIAIWILDDKIIKMQLVNPNLPSVNPKSKFDRLLEIPANNPEFSTIKKILDGEKV